MTGLLLLDVEVEGRRVDVRVAAGHVAGVGPHLEPRPGEQVVAGRGGVLLPGLADHHVHLLAMAARQGSLDCSPPSVVDRRSLADRLAGATPDRRGWVRAVGYDEQLAGPLDRDVLGGLCPAPLRVQERSGALWVLNEAAVQLLALDAADHPAVERDGAGRATGRLWRADAWLRERLRERAGPDLSPDLAAVGARLSAYGITAVTDATPDATPDATALLARARSRGELPQRVMVTGSGETPDGLLRGPVKLVLSDHDLPTLPELVGRLAPLRAAGCPVAVHAVTRTSLLLLLEALDVAGRVPGDRVEHAGVVPAEVAPRLQGLRVVTQPGFLADRGARMRRECSADDVPFLYPYASLLRAGVEVAPSSDAPFGPLDPWAVIRTAGDRVADDGEVLGAHERVPAATALAGYLSSLDAPGGPVRRVRPGAPADLCLLGEPLAAVLDDPTADQVQLTVVAGEVTGSSGAGWATGLT